MLASRCMINLHVEQVSDTPSERRRTLPVSKHFRQVRIYEKEQAAFVSKQATYRLSVHKYTATDTNETSQLFSALDPSTFCLKAIITVVSREYRHEFGAACMSPPPPTSKLSSSPRRGRSASASSPVTGSFYRSPDQ